MGVAKQRQAAEAAWMNGLNEQERTILNVAKTAHEKIIKALVATGMCYRMSFFLTEYLKKEHGIDVVPVVAFVNDGTENHLMISHAWIESNGKKTDIAITQTAHEAQLTGPMLIHDKLLTNGQATYTYHHERTADAVALTRQLMQDRRSAGQIAAKEDEHVRMVATAKSADLRRAYLDNAPDKMTYEKFAAMVRGA